MFPVVGGFARIATASRGTLATTATRLYAEASSSVAVVTTVSRGATDAVSTELPPPKYKTEIAMISGQPVKEASRTVAIYKPTRNSMQSGSYQTRNWKIEFDSQERWENPLMGWASSADALQAIDYHLRFDSLQAATAFATRNGWDYEIREAKTGKPTINRKYADNFKFVPGKLRFVNTK